MLDELEFVLDMCMQILKEKQRLLSNGMILKIGYTRGFSLSVQFFQFFLSSWNILFAYCLHPNLKIINTAL